jgi:hypothetical protein
MENHLLKCFSVANLVTFLSFDDVLVMVTVSKTLKNRLEEIDSIWSHILGRHFGRCHETENALTVLKGQKSETLFERRTEEEKLMTAGHLIRLRCVELASRFHFVSRSSLFRFWNVHIDTKKQAVYFTAYSSRNLIVLANICKVIQLVLSTDSMWRDPGPRELSFKGKSRANRPGIPTSHFHTMNRGQPNLVESLTFRAHHPLIFVAAKALGEGTMDPDQRELLSILSLHMVHLLSCNPIKAHSCVHLILDWRAQWHTKFLEYFVEVVPHWVKLISGEHGGHVDYHFYGKGVLGVKTSPFQSDSSREIEEIEIRNMRDFNARLHESMFTRGVCSLPTRPAGEESENESQELGRPLIAYMKLLLVLDMRHQIKKYRAFARDNAYAAWKCYLDAPDGYWRDGKESHNARRYRPFKMAFDVIQGRASTIGDPATASYALMIVTDVLEAVIQYAERKPSDDPCDTGAKVFAPEAEALGGIISFNFLIAETTSYIVNDARLMAIYRDFEHYLVSLPETEVNEGAKAHWARFLSSMREAIRINSSS